MSYKDARDLKASAFREGMSTDGTELGAQAAFGPLCSATGPTSGHEKPPILDEYSCDKELPVGRFSCASVRFSSRDNSWAGSGSVGLCESQTVACLQSRLVFAAKALSRATNGKRELGIVS